MCLGTQTHRHTYLDRLVSLAILKWIYQSTAWQPDNYSSVPLSHCRFLQNLKRHSALECSWSGVGVGVGVGIQH